MLYGMAGCITRCGNCRAGTAENTAHESMWWRSADQSKQNLKSLMEGIRSFAPWPILAGVRNNGTNAWLPSTALAFMGADQVGGPLIRGLSFALHSSSRHMQIQTLSICLVDQVAALISVCNAFAPQCEKDGHDIDSRHAASGSQHVATGCIVHTDLVVPAT